MSSCSLKRERDTAYRLLEAIYLSRHSTPSSSLCHSASSTKATPYSYFLQSDCAYTLGLFEASFERRPWFMRLVSESDRNIANVVIDEYESLDWDKVLSEPFLVTNNLCVRKGLCRKAHYAKFVAKHIEKCNHRTASSSSSSGTCPSSSSGRGTSPSLSTSSGGGKCPLSFMVPASVLVDTMPVFVTRPAMIDFRSALASCLGDAEEAMWDTKCSACREREEGALQGLSTSGISDKAAGSNSAVAASGAVIKPPTVCESCNLWILKPSLANKGADISIVQKIEDVEAAVKSLRDVGQWVLQKYLMKPLLINASDGSHSTTSTAERSSSSSSSGKGGHKFHLRIYVMADGALKAYVHRRGLVLIASEVYDLQSFQNSKAHITNTCANASAAHFDESLQVRSTDELPSLLYQFGACPSLSAAQARMGELWEAIDTAILHSFAAMEGEVSAYMPLPNAFELYGVDFLVGDDFSLHLLEFNPTPDIKQTGGRLRGLIADMIEGMVAITIDSRFPPPPAAEGLLLTATAGTTTPSASTVDSDPATLWKCVFEKAWPVQKGGIAMMAADD